MRKYWLLDQLGHKGPTALVETNGKMQVVGILRFGPGITELADQQALQNEVMGKMAPRLKPMVDGTSIDVDSVMPHEDLDDSTKAGSAKKNRADRRSANRSGGSGGRAASGPSRAGGRGDR